MRRVRTFLIFGLAVVFLIGFMKTGGAEEKFPSKQINWYVPSGAGGGTDIFTRTAALRLRRILKVPIVVTNMSGGAGARMLNFVAGQPRDGYTMFSFFSAMVGSMERGLTKVKFDDLVPLARGTDDPQTLVVNASSKYKTIEDIIADAKARPGMQRWGMASAAGIDGVTASAFAKMVGIKINLIPFKSGGQAVASLLGGHIEVSVANPSEVAGQVEAGRLKPVIAFTEKRLTIENFSNVPTAKEKGWDLVFSNWRGVLVLKGTPPERAKVLEKAVLKAMNHKVFQDYLKNNGMPRESVMNGEQFGAYMKRDFPAWREALIEMGFLKK